MRDAWAGPPVEVVAETRGARHGRERDARAAAPRASGGSTGSSVVCAASHAPRVRLLLPGYFARHGIAARVRPFWRPFPPLRVWWELRALRWLPAFRRRLADDAEPLRIPHETVRSLRDMIRAAQRSHRRRSSARGGGLRLAPPASAHRRRIHRCSVGSARGSTSTTPACTGRPSRSPTGSPGAGCDGLDRDGERPLAPSTSSSRAPLGRVVDALHDAWDPRRRVVPARARRPGDRPAAGACDARRSARRPARRSTASRSTSSRSARRTSSAARRGCSRSLRTLRREAGAVPVAAIVYPPRALERHAGWWPGFPWAAIAAQVDAVVPMLYTGGGLQAATTRPTATWRARSASLRDARWARACRVHAAGGVANRMTRRGARGVRRRRAGRRRASSRLEPLRLGDEHPRRLVGARAARAGRVAPSRLAVPEALPGALDERPRTPVASSRPGGCRRAAPISVHRAAGGHERPRPHR